MLPVGALYNAAYHTLRSGGRTFITFLFDSVYTCTVNLTLAYILTRFTDLGILSVYICVQLADVLKVIIGMILVHKGIWIRNLVDGKSDDEKEAV
jgi:Na+-driven multidrug efflux pump